MADWFVDYESYFFDEPDGDPCGFSIEAVEGMTIAKALDWARIEVGATGCFNRGQFVVRYRCNKWYRESTEVENKIAGRFVDQSVYMPCTPKAKKTGREYIVMDVLKMATTPERTSDD